MKVKGTFFTPGDVQVAIAQMLQMAFFGGLAVSLIGRSLLPEAQSKFIEANQMLILGGCFMCNIAAGNLLNTGAFEVAYNGSPVWSKMESGRFPQMDELKSALVAVMQMAQPATVDTPLPSGMLDAHPDL